MQGQQENAGSEHCPAAEVVAQRSTCQQQHREGQI
jgi:hypothetical protein